MSNHSSGRRVPRRRYGITAALAGLTLALLTACGGGSSGSSTDGTLRLAANLAPDYTSFDPVDTAQPQAFQLMSPVYGSFLHENEDGTYEPDLAKAVEIVDPKTITVELYEGQKFSDGSPFDAEVVKWGLERTKAADNQLAMRVAIQELQEIEVVTPTEVTLHLKTPIAGYFMNLLAQLETAIVSKKAVDDGVNLNSNPVGAGPFMVDAFSPEREYVLVKNPNYVHADDIKIDRVEYKHVAIGEPQAAANLLLSNEVDAVSGDTKLVPDSLKALEAGGISTRTITSPARWAQMSICKSQKPFDDVRVRQALNYAVDRQALVDTGAQGQGLPMWDYFPEESPMHDSGMDGFYERDIDKAKDLLAEAGQSDLSFDIAISPDMRRPAEVLQSQLAEAGIKVKLVQPANLVQDFFIEHEQPAGLFNSARKGLDKVSRTLLPGTVGNVCGWDDPDLNAVVAKAQGLEADSDVYAAAWKEITERTIKQGTAVYLYFGVENSAWNKDTIDELVYTPDPLGQLNVDITRTTLK